MDEAIDLLQLFVDSKIDAETFAGEFISLWREFRDEHDADIKAYGQNEERIKLKTDRLDRLISSEKFLEEQRKLDEMLPLRRIKPMSREDEIISHIMVESDAYEPNLEVRAAYAQYIGEVELLTEVRKALEALKAIRSANE